MQTLAKKHVESLQLMHEFASNTLQHIGSLSSAKHHVIDQMNKTLQNHELDTTFLLTQMITGYGASEDHIKTLLA